MENGLDDIILTPEEEAAAIAEAIKKAKQKKYGIQQSILYQQRILADRKFPSYKPDELEIIVKQKFYERYKRPYIVDNENRQIFLSLCEYFTGDKSFEHGGQGWSLDKGIVLFGHVGTGKTEMMKMFMLNQVQSYSLVSCRSITDAFTDEGGNEVERFYTNRKNPVPHKFGQEYSGYCFDDLGTEAIPVIHYGNKKNMMAEIILNRYDSKMNYRFTHITTNLTADQIRDNYGSRCIDRMREMFNLITFPVTATSRR